VKPGILLSGTAALLAPAIAVAPIGAPSALAQSAITPGMPVIDSAGHPVGIIAAVKAANVVLKTDKHEVTVPATSFTVDHGKLLFGMTADQVNAAAEQAATQAMAAIAPGAQVYGPDGKLVGTIDSLDDESVTIKLASGSLVRVTKTRVASNGQKVVVGATVAQLEASASPAPATEAAADAPADGGS
jgi:preprotein translocase subunit YajC